MTGARELWRVEIPGVAGETPYRVGALIDDGTQPGADELTEGWVKENFKHLKLDRVVKMAETPDYVDVRLIATSTDRSVPLTSRLGNALAALWRTARKPSSGNALRLKLDGEALRAGGRSGRFQIRPMRVVGSIALAKSILDKNRPAHAALVQSLRSSMGVIPFVGAGMSAAFSFPQWGDLLRRLAGPGQRNKVERHLRNNAFESAAEILYDRGRASDRLQEGITSSFDRPIQDADFIGKAVTLLPYLTAGPVITTNYDRVLERGFELANRPFTKSILGADPDEIVPAIQRNERVLFKIHGDCQTRRGLTLTWQSYELAYGGDRAAGRKVRDKLQGMLPILLTNRPFLFLGCSLETDRILEVVKKTFQHHARIGHYAILAAEYDADEYDRRAEEMASIGIRVLWYMPGAYSEVRALLRSLLEATSVETLQTGVSAKSAEMSATVAPVEETASTTSVTQALGLPPALRERIRRGNIIYFLGAAASGPMLGAEFYLSIARNNHVPEVFRSRSDIAQHLVDRNARSTLISEIANVMHTQFPEPSAIHRRFAALASRDGSRPAQRLILMTTNYDTGLESAFEERGTPFNLFVYQPHDRYEGKFIHRTPSGELRVIVRPEHLHELEGDEPVIVKMNGGPRLMASLPDTFSVATRDFYRLAARVPRAFPAFLTNELATRSLLIMAHGLKEPDVEEVIRFSCAQMDAGRSWALKWRPEDTGPDEAARKYWEAIGVDFLWGPIESCTEAILQAAALR
jgi:hypothetical protein